MIVFPVETERPTDSPSSERVPPQREIDKPFLVLSPLGLNDPKLQAWLFGLPTRALDETEQMRASELHELVSRCRNVASRLEEIAALIARGAAVAGPPTDPVEAATLAAEGAAAMFASEDDSRGGFTQLPTLFLAASPSDPTADPSSCRLTACAVCSSSHRTAVTTARPSLR